MGQISFKIEDQELEFLRWYANKNSKSMSTLYRDITLDTYRKWRIDALCKMYSEGRIGFKELCRKANISLTEGLMLLQERNIEPPISEAMDNHTSNVRDKLIQQLNSKSK